MDHKSASAEDLLPAYSGIPTFMRCPVSRDLTNADTESWIQIGIRGPGTHS
jgi:hypothetical protein